MKIRKMLGLEERRWFVRYKHEGSGEMIDDFSANSLIGFWTGQVKLPLKDVIDQIHRLSPHVVLVSKRVQFSESSRFKRKLRKLLDWLNVD